MKSSTSPTLAQTIAILALEGKRKKIVALGQKLKKQLNTKIALWEVEEIFHKAVEIIHTNHPTKIEVIAMLLTCLDSISEPHNQ